MIGQLSARFSPMVMRAIRESHILNHTMEKHEFLLKATLSLPKGFHTTPKRDIHPVILLLLKPVGKLTAIITGRVMRNKLKGANPVEKAKWRNSLWNARYKIAGAGGFLSVAAALNFATHIQETPVTKRKRFIAFTNEQFLKLAKFYSDLQMEGIKDQIVPPSDPVYKVVMNVAQKIVNSNQEYDFFREQKWTVIVVDSEEENAFVTPNGHIFVYTGLLRVVGEDSRLAAVLGHEMAHAFLRHNAEQVSYAAVIDWFIILVMAAIWVIVPNDGIALITQWFYNKVVNIFLHLPYSRKLEEEADYVGLQLMAKACFDVRDSSAFWDLMDLRENHVKDDESRPPPEFLSTHPASNKRVEKFNDWMAKAIEVRKACNCPSLPHKDPREEIQALRASIEAEKKREEEQRRQEEERKKTEILHPKPGAQGVIVGALKSAKS